MEVKSNNISNSYVALVNHVYFSQPLPPVGYLDTSFHETAVATGRCRTHGQSTAPTAGAGLLLRETKDDRPAPSLDTRHDGHHLNETTLLGRHWRRVDVIGPCLAGLGRTPGRSQLNDLTSG